MKENKPTLPEWKKKRLLVLCSALIFCKDGWLIKLIYTEPYRKFSYNKVWLVKDIVKHSQMSDFAYVLITRKIQVQSW